jgi:hypothetical protein
MRASASEDDSGLARFDLDIAAIGTPAFTVAHAQFHVRRDPGNDALDVYVAADDVRFKSPAQASLGDRIEMLKVSATMFPGKVFARLRAGDAAWPEVLRNFERVNGTLHIDDFEIALNELSADGHGTLAVDSDLRPKGLIDLHMQHLEKFLATARGRGPERHADGIAAALAARAGEGGNDESGRPSVVFTCSGGITYLGNQPIGMLGTLL